jgi:hypothetical protein
VIWLRNDSRAETSAISAELKTLLNEETFSIEPTTNILKKQIAISLKD